MLGGWAPGWAPDSEEMTTTPGAPTAGLKFKNTALRLPSKDPRAVFSLPQHPQNGSGVNCPHRTQGSGKMVSARPPASRSSLESSSDPCLNLGWGWGVGGLNCRPSRGKAWSLSRVAQALLAPAHDSCPPAPPPSPLHLLPLSVEPDRTQKSPEFSEGATSVSRDEGVGSGRQQGDSAGGQGLEESQGAWGGEAGWDTARPLSVWMGWDSGAWGLGAGSRRAWTCVLGPRDPGSSEPQLCPSLWVTLGMVHCPGSLSTGLINDRAVGRSHEVINIVFGVVPGTSKACNKCQLSSLSLLSSALRTG